MFYFSGGRRQTRVLMFIVVMLFCNMYFSLLGININQSMIYVSMYMVRTLCRWGRIYYRNPAHSHCFSDSFGFVIIRQLSITFIILIVFWHGVAHGCTKVIKATFGGNFKYTTWLWWSASSCITPTNYEHFPDVVFIMIIQRSIILTHFRVTSPALNSLYICANINEEP